MQREILQTQKSQTTGKRVGLKGKFVFSTQEVLEIASKAKEATAAKALHKQHCTKPIATEVAEQETELLENVSSDSDSDCIVVLQREGK